MADATKATDSLPTEALKEAGQKLLTLLVQRATQAATDRVSELSDRLTDVAEHGGPGLKALVSGGTALAEGKSPLRAALSSGMTGLSESVKSLFGGGGGGGKQKLKVTVISEGMDVGLPLRSTYNLWTNFADFPTFMKKVENVDQNEDVTTNWKAQVFWSHRTWEATIVEQVPDSHIVWRSKGEKGHVDGAVTFTGLGPNLTRVLLLLEYHPQGLFERTGNLWRAQGRRARLEFQHFRRHAMVHVLAEDEEPEGWRGEIRDGEVVVTHDEAVSREQEEPEEAEETAPEDEYAEAEEEYGDEEGEEAGEEPQEEYADEADEEEPYEDEDYDEYDEEAEEYPDEDAEYEEDEGPADETARGEPAPAGRGR
jgi:hypothetical protein